MFNPGEIYLALPSLKAYLETHGYKAQVLDVNVIINDIILSKKFLEKVLLEYGENVRASLPESEINTLINNVDHAKQILRSEDFYLKEQYLTALHIIRRAMELIDKIFKPYGGLLIESFGAYRYQQDSKEVAKLITQNKTIYSILYDEYIVSEILKSNTKLVGISITFSDQLIPSLLLARKLKDYDKHFSIVVGGNLVTHLHRNESFLRLLSLAGVDAAVIFEGEYALLKIVEVFDKNRESLKTSLCEIPNVIYLDANRYKLPEKIYVVKDLNDIPTPNFDDLPLDKYLTPHIVFPLLTSRGCYWSKCVFCNIPYGYYKYRFRDVEHVINDIKLLISKYNAKYIAFRDCCIPPEYMYELSKRIIEEGIEVKMYAEIRAEETFRYEHFKTAYEAGFRVLWVGVESYSQRILNLMRKGITREGIRRCLEFMKKAGMWVHVYIILGFPGETEEDLYETINFILTNHNIDSVEFSPFSLVENSPIILEGIAEKYGIVLKGKDYDLSLVYRYVLKDVPLQGENRKINEYINRIYSNEAQSFFNLVIPSYGTWLLLYVSKCGVNATKKVLQTLISSFNEVPNEN